MKKITFLFFMVAFMVGFANGPAHSTLLESDWQTAGDGLVIWDTDTNLEWLNLTQSNGMSYSEVYSACSSGGSFEGMRYATNSEVINLWTNYFSIDLSSANLFLEYPGYIDPGVRMASEALGTGISGGTDTYSGPNANYRLLGITADLRNDNGEHFILGARTRWSDTDYYSARDPWPIFSGLSIPAEASADGSYLVRERATAPVPEPSTMFLFGAGLLGLAGTCRKKSSRKK